MKITFSNTFKEKLKLSLFIGGGALFAFVGCVSMLAVVTLLGWPALLAHIVSGLLGVGYFAWVVTLVVVSVSYFDY